ncbi:MAG: hypothetical protein E7C93_00655 [Veillonella sp.]|nr:hypothetical protein [Veillonella sp.]MDU2576036.1 hypothetical protein [Veillonella sp.]
MSVHNNALSLLSQIYDAQNTNGAFNIARDIFDSLSVAERHSLEMQVEYLKEAGFVKNYIPCTGLPISLKLTALGIQEVENIQTNASSTSINIMGANYGIVGDNNSSNIINNNCSFSDVQELIKSSDFSEEDKALLLKELKSLYDRIEMKAPIEQGMLSSIADKIKDYQPLLGAVLSSLTTFLTTPK